MKMLSACMVLVAATVSVAFIRQVVFLDRELVCDGTWFPSERCTMTVPEHSHPVPEHPHPHTHATAPEHSHPVQLAEHSHSVPLGDSLPIGAIVAFFGTDSQIPDGWMVCDGRNVPADSPITADANPEMGGLQLPDLRGRFIRGAERSISVAYLSYGGRDMISAAHAHLWGRYVNKGWILYDDHGGSHQVIQWGTGFGNEGSGHYSLARTTAASADYHTTQALGGYDNRPAYTELRYIIKVLSQER